MKNLILLSAFVLFVTGCATTYQPQSFTGGFSEARLGENMFRVTFKGNGYSGTDRVADFVLLRSAELTLEHGFRYFIIAESGKDAKSAIITTPTTSHTTFYKGFANTNTYGGQSFIVRKPSANNTIVLYRDKPEINGIVYDATFIKKSIKQKYGLDKKKIK